MTKSTTQKIFAAVLSIAIVLTLVVGVATSSANAQTASAMSSYSYTRSLTVGSSGADVTALQTMLSNGGYLKVAPTGYFGSLTKAALAAWQAFVGISPASGYFGPITRSYIAMNGGGPTGGTSGALCPNGNTLASNCSLAPNAQAGGLCPNGMTLASNCSLAPNAQGGGTTGGTWTPDGTDGSITTSYVSYAPASQTLKKGDMNKPLISVKLQAVNGKTAVTRMDVHFSERPWLDFGSLTLTDSSGNILATKTLNSASDVTEVTVGSDYLVRFDNINPIIVTPGNDMIVAVAANVLAASDKITGQTVYVGVPAGSIRTINGKGYTDSVGLSSGQGSAANSSSGNSVVLSSTGSTGSIFTRIDPSSPATKTTVVTSATQVTQGKVLGVFGLKSQNQSSTINGLTFNLNTSGTLDAAHIYSNVRLQVNGQTYGSNAVGTTTTFTNLNFPLAQDAWVPATLIADIQSNVTGVSASSTLVASGIVGVDANYNNVSVSNATNQTSTDNVYSTSGISIANASTVIVNDCSATYVANINDHCTLTTTFTVTNVGNADIFISKNPAIALATSSTPSTASTTLSSINISAGAGDTSTSYDVTSGGSRTFTYSGTFSKKGGGPVSETFSVTGIRFGTVTTDDTTDAGAASTATTASTNGASIINFGLETLTTPAKTL